MKRPAVFLDRDGVLLEERGYVTRPEEVRLLPGAAAAVRSLRASAYAVVLVTNQSAIARGLLSLAELEALHTRLVSLLQDADARLDGIYYCPHHPHGVVPELSAACSCRKPGVGLLIQAASELGLELGSRSLLVGDQLTDMQCAVAAGVRPILVRTGKGTSTEPQLSQLGMHVEVVDSLAQVPALLASGRGLEPT